MAKELNLNKVVKPKVVKPVSVMHSWLDGRILVKNLVVTGRLEEALQSVNAIRGPRFEPDNKTLSYEYYDFEDCKFIGNGSKSALGWVHDCSFTNCEFNNYNFGRAEFSGGSFEDCKFDHSSLSVCEFNRCTLNHTVFDHTSLYGTRFGNGDERSSSTQLSDCKFLDVNMDGSALNNCKMVDVTFGGKSNLSNMTCNDAGFDGIKLMDGVKFEKLNTNRCHFHVESDLKLAFDSDCQFKHSKFELDEDSSAMSLHDCCLEDSMIVCKDINNIEFNDVRMAGSHIVAPNIGELKLIKSELTDVKLYTKDPYSIENRNSDKPIKPLSHALTQTILTSKLNKYIADQQSVREEMLAKADALASTVEQDGEQEHDGLE